MLVLEPKYNEPIILHDTQSGNVVKLWMFKKATTGVIQLAFDAPQTVCIDRQTRIDRKMRRNENNQSKPDKTATRRY